MDIYMELKKSAFCAVSITKRGSIMTEEQLKTIHSLYTDLWKLFKDHSSIVPGASQSVWDELAEKGQALVEQYGEDKRQIVLDTLELIERSSRK